MQEYKRIEISKDQVVPIAEKMRKAGVGLAMIHGFLNECASDTDAGVSAVKRMMEVCHREDPSRPATFASNRVRNDRCLELVAYA